MIQIEGNLIFRNFAFIFYANEVKYKQIVLLEIKDVTKHSIILSSLTFLTDWSGFITMVFFLYELIFFYSILYCMHVVVYLCHATLVGVNGKFVEISFRSPCRSWKLNSGWHQVLYLVIIMPAHISYLLLKSLVTQCNIILYCEYSVTHKTQNTT